MFRRKKPTAAVAQNRLRFATVAALDAGFTEADVMVLVRRAVADHRLVYGK